MMSKTFAAALRILPIVRTHFGSAKATTCTKSLRFGLQAQVSSAMKKCAEVKARMHTPRYQHSFEAPDIEGGYQ